MEGETSVFVRIKELSESMAFVLSHAIHSVFSEEIVDLVAGNVLVAISVKSLEGSRGSEISDLTEPLSGSFELALSVSNSN